MFFTTKAAIRAASRKGRFSRRGGAVARFLTGLAAASALALPLAAHAANANWVGTTDGNWNTTTNWSTGALPNNSSAYFINSTPNNTISLAAAVPIFSLDFSGNTLANYTFGGAQFQSSGPGANINVQASVNNGATITFNNNNQATSTNRISPSGYSIITAAGSNANLIFNGNLFASVGTAGIIFTIDYKLSNAAASGSTVVNGLITDSGLGKTGITKTGGGQGVLTLNGANTYSGQTAWNTDSGSFSLGNKSAFGTGALRIAGTSAVGTLSASTALTGANAIANTINYNSANTSTTTSNATISFTAGSSTGTLTGGTTPAVGDVVTVGAQYMPLYARVTGVSGATITFDTAAATTGSIALTTQNYTSSSTGTLTVGGANALEFSGTQNLSTVFSNGGTATRTFNITNTADTIFSGVLQQQSGVASVVKTGTGSLILTNANTYTGTTTINAGTLAVTNTAGSATGTGAVTVGGGATLTGTGAVSGAVTDSGTLNAGGVGVVGALATGAETFTSGSSLVFDFGNDAIDALTSSGIVTGLNNATLTFTQLTGSTGLLQPSYVLLSAASFASGTTLPTSATTPAGYQLQLTSTALNLVQIAAAPEPSQWAALLVGALGIGGLALRARRRTPQAS